MPKSRKSKAPKVVHPGGQLLDRDDLRFVNVQTSELLVIEDLKVIESLDVKGRFVKVAPKIEASYRDSFDGPAVSEALREAGARAVILAPVYLTETRKAAEQVSEAKSDRDALKVWIGAQNVSEADDLKAAEELVLGFMDLEGM